MYTIAKGSHLASSSAAKATVLSNPGMHGYTVVFLDKTRSRRFLAPKVVVKVDSQTLKGTDNAIR